MKEETKELIDWIKKQINLCGECLVAQPEGCWKNDKDKAFNFLDSLPEIESHLCRGGYIQDKNGTPCCDGDRIKVHGFIDGEEGTVYGILRYGFMKGEEKKYMIFPHWWFDLDNNASCLPEEGFEKVEK